MTLQRRIAFLAVCAFAPTLAAAVELKPGNANRTYLELERE